MPDPTCPIESTLDLINGKWKLSILKILSQGPVRYGRIGAEIPEVSAKVLTQQLRELEQDGIVLRTVYPEIPPRVEYSLTEMGVGLFVIFGAMRAWGLEKDNLRKPVCKKCERCMPIQVKEMMMQKYR